jgi:hypothetical protein
MALRILDWGLCMTTILDLLAPLSSEIHIYFSILKKGCRYISPEIFFYKYFSEIPQSHDPDEDNIHNIHSFI